MSESDRESLASDLARMDAQTLDLDGEGGVPATATPSRRYVLLDRLGAGGMGTVYVAYDAHLERKVAIKFLHRAENVAARTRFKREALALARLKHPNVVTIFDAGVAGERPFLAMELVEGTSLSRWLASANRSCREIATVFLGAGRGLAAAHAAGLVHRDVKPDNILVARDGSVRIADFGVVGLLDEDEPRDGTEEARGTLTRPGKAPGTPRYMAPEQARGEVDARSDQYAFCVALTEALGAQRVPARLLDAARRGRAPDPADRFPDMEPLLAALAHDPSAGRRRLLAALAVVTLGCAALFFAVRGRGDGAVCTGGPALAAEVWNPEARGRVRAAFLATHLPYAEVTGQRVVAELDAWTGDWAHAHTEACAATERRHEQSPTALDLRMACLERLRLEARALVGELATADARAVEEAGTSVGRLGDVHGCDRVDVLAALPPLPADPRLRHQVNRLQARLAQAAAARLVARLAPARDTAGAVVAAARPLGYLPLLGRALLEQGRVQNALVDNRGAEASLREALALAARTRDDQLAADAWDELYYALEQMTRTAEVDALGLAYDLAVARSGDDPRRRARALVQHARVRWLLGDSPGALALAERSLALLEASGGRDSLDVADTLLVIADQLNAQGQRQAALARLERALAIVTAALGPLHPRVAQVLQVMGPTLEHVGRPHEARAALERGLAIAEGAFGPEGGKLFALLINLANLEIHEDRLDEAQGHLERAIALFEKLQGPRARGLWAPLVNLSEVLRGRGRLAEAGAALARARVIVTEAYPPTHRRVVETLMADGEQLVAEQRPAEAADAFRRAAALVADGAGKNPSLLAQAQTLLAATLCRSGDARDGEPLAESAIAFDEKNAPDSPELAAGLSALGDCLLAAGKPAAAAPLLERALSLQAAPRRVAHARFALARSLWASPPDHARALQLAGLAADDLHRRHPDDPELAEMTRWLALRGAPRSFARPTGGPPR